jgi:RimJ/RimL family protein N-acetyltransferase
MTIFAETSRLVLRSLEKNNLPAMATLIGDWEVARWLIRPPYPYTMKDAEEFYEIQRANYERNMPNYFVIMRKADNRFLGAVSLEFDHPDTESVSGDCVLGYWLGKSFWGEGYMTEAVTAALALAFNRDGTEAVITTTDPANAASQKVLQKTGFDYLGIFPRSFEALRGSKEVTRWRLTRTDFEMRRNA